MIHLLSYLRQENEDEFVQPGWAKYPVSDLRFADE